MWKYFQKINYHKLDDDTLNKLYAYVMLMMKLNNNRRALKELNKFVYRIPDDSLDFRIKCFDVLYRLYEKIGHQDNEFFTAAYFKGWFRLKERK